MWDLLNSNANPKFCIHARCHIFLFTISIFEENENIFFMPDLSDIELHVCLTEHIFTITGSIAKGSVQSVWNSSHLFRFTCKNIYVLPRTASVASFKEWLSMQIGIISAWNNLQKSRKCSMLTWQQYVFFLMQKRFHHAAFGVHEDKLFKKNLL